MSYGVIVALSLLIWLLAGLLVTIVFCWRHWRLGRGWTRLDWRPFLLCVLLWPLAIPCWLLLRLEDRYNSPQDPPS